MPNWLPEEYKAPLPTKKVVQEPPAQQLPASPLVGDIDFSQDSLMLTKDVLTQMMRETKIGQRYFQLGAQRGFKRYEIQAIFNQGTFLGLKLNLLKK